MFTILENFLETILFILLGNIASSLKFEFICRKIGLVLFAMELDTHELFRCVTATWLQLPWWNSKADCITRVSKLRSSWRFLKFSEALHVYPNRFYVHNQVSQKAKGEISNWDAIANPKRAIQVQVMFSAKKNPDWRHRWPEIQLR